MKRLMEEIKEHIKDQNLRDFWFKGWFVIFAATTIALW